MLDKVARGFALFVNWFNGICAIVCGALMMTGLWNDLIPLSLFENFPLRDVFFTSLFWPGLALALVNGVPNLIALALRARGKRASSYTWGMVAGGMLVVWTAIEMVYVPNGLSVAYMLIGVLQLAASWHARRAWQAAA